MSRFVPGPRRGQYAVVPSPLLGFAGALDALELPGQPLGSNRIPPAYQLSLNEAYLIPEKQMNREEIS